MKHITKQEALTKINSSNGRVFGVVFEKADGTMRKMSGRIDVTKHLKGGVATYKGKDGSKQNVGLYEMAGTSLSRFFMMLKRCTVLNSLVWSVKNVEESYIQTLQLY